MSVPGNISQFGNLPLVRDQLGLGPLATVQTLVGLTVANQTLSIDSTADAITIGTTTIAPGGTTLTLTGLTTLGVNTITAASATTLSLVGGATSGNVTISTNGGTLAATFSGANTTLAGTLNLNGGATTTAGITTIGSGGTAAAYSAIEILRTLGDTSTGTGHGFDDGSLLGYSQGYASYSANPVVTSTGFNPDHYVAFQATPTWNTTGQTLANMFSSKTRVSVLNGTITNLYGYYFDSPTISGTGAVTNRWAFYNNDSSATVYSAGPLSAGAGTFAGNLTVAGTGTSSFAGPVSLGTAGNTISIKSGANAASGTVTLVAGTATITSTAIDTNTVIQFSEKTAGGTPGVYQPLAAVRAGSAVVTSAATDTSTYNWIAMKVN